MISNRHARSLLRQYKSVPLNQAAATGTTPSLAALLAEINRIPINEHRSELTKWLAALTYDIQNRKVAGQYVYLLPWYEPEENSLDTHPAGVPEFETF